MNDYRASMTERQLLDATIEEFARAGGWMMMHTPDAWLGQLKQLGIMQRYQIDTNLKGFPDLVIVGHGKCLFRELKDARGSLSPEQVAWRDALLEAGQDWALWRPKDRSLISELAWAHREVISR